jgi:hypothetical protein|tara:strand:- start:279 stop:401 length:123 start_codon:yes stop_codon:yes gene_type:complete
MRVPKGIVFTKFDVGPYEIYIFQDEDGLLLTVKTYEYDEY